MEFTCIWRHVAGNSIEDKMRNESSIARIRSIVQFTSNWMYGVCTNVEDHMRDKWWLLS